MDKCIAYFSMEYAVEENFPIYAGGLGVLAADLVLQAGSEGRRFIALGLFYSQGFYAHYQNENHKLDPQSVGFTLLKDSLGKDLHFSAPVGRDEVWFQVWQKNYGSAQLFLLDTNTSANNITSQKITEHLYDRDKDVFFKQQIILALGSSKVLRHLTIQPDVYHLNEGHTGLVLLQLAAQLHKDKPEIPFEQCVKLAGEKVVATKHTILTGGGLHLAADKIHPVLDKYLQDFAIPFPEFFNLGTHSSHPQSFSTTNFLLRFAHRGSAVSFAHAAAEKKVHPHSNLIPITNGINQTRWQPKSTNQSQVSDLSDGDLWQWHKANKRILMDHLYATQGRTLYQDVLTVAWARRFTSYKRPELLFSNLDELTKMTKLIPSIQFIVAGQTNPSDSDAQELAQRIMENLKEKGLENRILFITEYPLTLARKLTAGADVWLNTPLPGLEASGTSGMKAGINGVLELTTADGWVTEVNWDNLGWILDEKDISSHLYSILEQQVIPMYYKMDQKSLPAEWISRMRRTIQVVEQKYTTQRLLKDYYDKLYFSSQEF